MFHNISSQTDYNSQAKQIFLWSILLPLVFTPPSLSGEPHSKQYYVTADKVENLPDRFKQRLIQSGCKIPLQQISYKDESGYHYTWKPAVVSGQFAKTGQKDWAVFCIIKNEEAIHIHWGGTASCPDKTNTLVVADGGYSAPGGNNSFQRYIRSVDKSYITQRYKRYASQERFPKLPPLDHTAIEDGVLERASGLIYCHNGKWIQLPGAD
ncbi:MAG: hypothetical protein OEY52_02440 [Gammaproteobacteria bacterium]|nr:hypothetical protein [Gammaproteobacteria bacterium]